MRKEIVEFEQHFEEQRIRSMAWWDNSARCREEKAAQKEVMDDYEILKGKLSPEARMLLDRVEEEWYLLKEAELQATYMQGISDGLELGVQRRQNRIGMTEHKCRRVSQYIAILKMMYACTVISKNDIPGRTDKEGAAISMDLDNQRNEKFNIGQRHMT